MSQSSPLLVSERDQPRMEKSVYTEVGLEGISPWWRELELLPCGVLLPLLSPQNAREDV